MVTELRNFMVEEFEREKAAMVEEFEREKAAAAEREKAAAALRAHEKKAAAALRAHELARVLAPPPLKTVEQQLVELKESFDNDFITQEVYDSLRTKCLLANF